MTRGPWPAPCAREQLEAVVTLPSSKSHTNRCLVLAALAPGTSRLRRPLRSLDTEVMVAGLRALGAEVGDGDGGDWLVTGPPRHERGDHRHVEVGNAGTVARFLPSVAALGVARVTFDGAPAMRRRPMRPLLCALRELGADLDHVEGLPLRVTGHGRLNGGEVVVDAAASSQLVSGLLLAAPRYDDGVVVRHEGRPMPSAPYVEMTLAALRSAGAVVHGGGGRSTWAVAPGALSTLDVTIEPDLSTAAVYLAAPLVAGGTVRISGWPQSSCQPGALLPDLLVAMGAKVRQLDDELVLTGDDGLHGIDADLRQAGELTPVLTVLAALADSPSRLRGVAHLRLHESNRLAALTGELNALGADVREVADGLEVRPQTLRPGLVRSHDDHRLAMAWALLGLAVDGVVIDDIATTRKTVPDFVGSWEGMLGS